VYENIIETITDSMRNNKTYGGTTDKFGITINNNDYIVKFAKDGCESSVYSEYVASRFINLIGIKAHEVHLCKYKGELVDVIKDFTSKGITLKSYGDTGQSSKYTDTSNKEYTYNDVLKMIENHRKLIDKNKMTIQFWQMFICDAILGNRDRHSHNWGYLDMGNKKYVPAPLFDNGGSLFPSVSKVISEYTPDNEYSFISIRAGFFPTSLLKIEVDGKLKRTNYYEIIGNLNISPTLEQQVNMLIKNIGFKGIYNGITKAVDNKYIPNIYKRFYIMIVCVRYLHIIERMNIEDAYKMTLIKR